MYFDFVYICTRGEFAIKEFQLPEVLNLFYQTKIRSSEILKLL